MKNRSFDVLRFENDTHVCNAKSTAYRNNKVCNKHDDVAMTNCRNKKKIKKNSMIFFDLETFQDALSYGCQGMYE